MHSETVFKEKLGVWDPAGVVYNSPYLIVNSVVSYPPALYTVRTGQCKAKL
jgi:hypothetical protein